MMYKCNHMNKDVLTVALFAVSTQFESGVTNTDEGAGRVDTAMGALGRVHPAFIHVWGTFQWNTQEGETH